MIDFSRLKKFIYFPRWHERHTEPYVIHVLDRWGTDWRGNPDAQELLARKFAFYPIVRCQPYSEALWNACQAWCERRAELQRDFESLRMKGRL